MSVKILYCNLKQRKRCKTAMNLCTRYVRCTQVHTQRERASIRYVLRNVFLKVRLTS